jgi:septum formation protein
MGAVKEFYMSARLLLASSSPRRSELLRQMAYSFDVVPINLPELVAPGESPTSYVQRVALEKARAGLSTRPDDDVVALGADTEVILDGRIFGKPTDAADACAMLQSLQGRVHEVLCAVAVVNHSTEQVLLSHSRVHFAAMDEARIARYVASGEAMGKAGAYGIQGLAAAFIQHLEGSYWAVMGLPMFETAQLLEQFGVKAEA